MLSTLKRHGNVIGFGILEIFFSAPGQTFLISLFVAKIFQDLPVSLSSFAGIYSAATLAASFLLNPAGQIIDRYPVRKVAAGVSILMALGCLGLAFSKNVVGIFVAFFILRLIGQGVLGLTATTLVIKKFLRNRGKALSLIMLGYPLSEMIYPFVSLFFLEHFGWRWTYIWLGLSNVLILFPLQLLLLRGVGTQSNQFLPGEETADPEDEQRSLQIAAKDWTLAMVVRDVKFYLLLASSCLPPMVVTGLFFHQGILFKLHGWPIGMAATGFSVYAVTKAFSSLGIGPLVDRTGPLGPFTAIIGLLGIGTLLAGIGSTPVMCYLYFALIGAALGFSSPVTNVIWPYFYGIKHIGSIKGLIATFRNGLTALGPLPIALALDAGWTMDKILLGIAIGILVMMALPWLAWRMAERERSAFVRGPAQTIE